jgi:hypothetical protein
MSDTDAKPAMGMHVIMTGNPVEGFQIVGPFKVPSEAIEWATDNCVAEWWAVQLESPEGFKG